jgi:hypothetical protein
MTSVAFDLGALTVKIATQDGVVTVPAPSGGPRAGIRAALAVTGARSGCCVAVPEAWLTGTTDGASRQEDVRHVCEEVAGAGPVTWTGQLAAVAALSARQPGRYLVCDVGGSGVRAGRFGVADGTVAIEATHAEDGGGWRDFDTAIRSGLPAGLPGTWYEQAIAQEGRAGMVLADAAVSPDEFGDTRVYRISGPGGDIGLTASRVIDSFAPTRQRLQTSIQAVTGAGRPDGVVLAGGLSWLPLAAQAMAVAVGTAPEVAGCDAAARGALLFARGEARLAPPDDTQTVTLPAHYIRDGLLEEFSVTLPWTVSFAALPDGALTIDQDKLELMVAGQPRIALLRDLVPGPHRVGVRPAWPGPGVLVVRPVTGDSAHVVPLASLTAR